MTHAQPEPCESSPSHESAVGQLQIVSRLPIALCGECLRATIGAWIEDARDDETVSPVFAIVPCQRAA